MDMLKSEQKRIDDDIAETENRLEGLNASKEQFNKIMNQAILMASSCHGACLKASPKTRRMFNQAFFKKIYVKDLQIDRVEHTPLFDFLFSSLSPTKRTLFFLRVRISHNWLPVVDDVRTAVMRSMPSIELPVFDSFGWKVRSLTDP